MGWIAPNKKELKIGETLKLTAGDAGSIIKPYRYNVYLCATDTEYILAAENVSYAALDGKEIAIDGDKFAALASPFKPGRLLTVKAEGSYKVLGNEKRVTMTTSIYLYCEQLVPQFTLSARGRDTKSVFGENIVAGYSYIELKADEPQLPFGGSTESVEFYGSEIFTSDNSDKFIARSGVINSPGSRSAACRITATYRGMKPNGETFETSWSKTATVNITVKSYTPPFIDTGYASSIKPVRTDTSGNILGYGDMSPTARYPFKFRFRIKTDNNLGVKIKDIKSVKIFNTNDKGAVENDVVSIGISVTEETDIEETDFSRIVEQEGYSVNPAFIEDTGCLIYRQYPIEITVTDDVGTYVLKTALQSVFVTAHIQAGGRSIKIGGYATENMTVAIDKAWKFHAEGNIQCDGELEAKKVSLSSIKWNGITYGGVGKSVTNFAAGNHTHGKITSDGKLTSAEDYKKYNYPVIVGPDGYITWGDKFPEAMYYKEIPKVWGINEGDIVGGSCGSSNLIARGDHIHPTDTSRAAKVEFDNLSDEFHAFKDKYNGFL